MTKHRRALYVVWAAGLFTIAATATDARGAPASGEGPRWTAATPDAMLDEAARRGKLGGAEGLSALAVMRSLAPRASAGRALSALSELGRGDGDIAAEARWVAAELDPNEVARPGLVRNLAVLGPFQDTGGGLARREGPEAGGFDRAATYDWGAYEARWRDVPTELVSARGVPLDLLVHPRKESCTYLASSVTLKDDTPIVVRVAASGAVRLSWDGIDAATSEDVHPRLLFDRLAAKIASSAGAHLLSVKVCSGALDDDGRVRIRVEDTSGNPLDVASSTGLASPTKPKPPSITRVKTPLEKALDVGKSPANAPALAASILRTLGGADDLRSPRAPGMLDEVANAKGASPDVIAMAGWVSPFGSSRSGFLNLAITRALATGDSATASFAERRLAASRLSARFVDWAMAGIAREPLASENDPEARLLRAMVRAELGIESLRRLALADAREIARQQGEKTSIATWSEIHELASTFDRGLAADVAEKLTKLAPEQRDARFVQEMSARDAAAVQRAARAAFASGGITTADDLVDVAQALEQAGLYDEAASAWQRAADWAPNRAAAFAGLAQALYRKGDAAQGDLALRRARDLEPGEAAYRAELAFRSRARTPADGDGHDRGGAAQDHAADEQYLVAPSEFLARKAASPAVKGEVADRELHWMRAVTLHPDRRVSQLIQYAREIVIEPRTQDELYEPIPAEGDETEILRARVHRATGGVAFAEEQKAEGGRASIRWPDLHEGDVIEVAVRTWTSGPVGRRGDPPYYFVDYAGAVATHPLLYNEVIIDSPVDRPLAVDVLHGKPDQFSDDVKNGRKIVRLVWENPPNVADEPLAPRPSEILPTIVGSTFGSWKEFRDWYQAAVEGFTEPDDQVRRLAAELTKGKTSRDEKVKAIFEYVADDIRYVNYVSGEWWLPNRPQQLLARRQGDCDDKAILLITLLKAVGIEATEVLLQTRYTAQPSILRSEKAAVPLFDHGIAYLPGEKGATGTWLDATSPSSRLGPVPSMDARAWALFATEGPAHIVTTPSSHPGEHGIDGTWTLTLGPSGAGELDADERHAGDHAFLLRSNLREKDARAQWVEQNLVAAWFPTVEVGAEVDFTSDLPHGAARVHYRAHSDGLGRREGDDLVVPLAPASTLTSQLAPLVKRTLPVVLPPHTAPSHQSRTIRVVPPEGYELADLPPGGAAEGGPFGRAHLAIARDPKNPRAAIVERSVVFDMSTIPTDQYEAWRGWLQKVDALLHRSVRFTKARPSRTTPTPTVAKIGGSTR